jgi:hypothetical protein
MSFFEGTDVWTLGVILGLTLVTLVTFVTVVISSSS